MEYQKISNEPHSSLIINKVESGMPHWLIEMGFIMKIIQAVSTSIDLCNWIETNGMVIPRAIVFLHHPVGLPIRQQNTDSTGYQKGKKHSSNQNCTSCHYKAICPQRYLIFSE